MDYIKDKITQFIGNMLKVQYNGCTFTIYEIKFLSITKNDDLTYSCDVSVTEGPDITSLQTLAYHIIYNEMTDSFDCFQWIYDVKMVNGEIKW